MHRPIIGITSGVVVNKDYPNSPAVMGQQHTYVQAVMRAGGLPMILPLLGDDQALQQLYGMCDGILFAGGNDIHPSFYGEQPSPMLQSTDQERDRQELQLWNLAKANGKPVLGVCRGMQLMNVGNGGTLIQDIPSELPEAEVHRVDPDHSKPDDYKQIMHHINISADSRLAQILGSTKNVPTNAFHHQAVKKLGEEFTITATTSDGVVEAMEIPGSRFVIGVQSHPESLESKIAPVWRKLFSAFVDACR